jgi:diguanylate cyclase (GGDEF)-like protein
MDIDSTNKKPNSVNLKVLLIDHDPRDVRLFKEIFKEIKSIPLEHQWVTNLSEGSEKLKNNDFDIVIIDLSLTDSSKLVSFCKLNADTSNAVIIGLANSQDEEYGVKALKMGAQDYLIKDEINRKSIRRSLYYAMQRNKMNEKLRLFSLSDELTGLFNLRGLENLIPNILNIADRTERKSYLFFIDMDNLKVIRDTYGLKERNKAINDTVGILKKTFRKSDIIAKIGGDEFAILTLQPIEGNKKIVFRLKSSLDTFNVKSEKPYNLSVNVGVAFCPTDNTYSIDNLSKKVSRVKICN